MTASPDEKFRFEISEMPSEHGKPTAVVKCYGRLVAGDTGPLRTAVAPFIERGGRTVVDCSDLAYVDSMGLGALVSLKVSSIHKGFGTLEFVNLSPRVMELLRITKLTDYFAKPETAS